MLKRCKMKGFTDSTHSVKIRAITANALQSLDQRDFDKMFSKSVHSVRKALEGNGVTPYHADVEIAVSEAISTFWERSRQVDRNRVQFYQQTGIRLPLQAFINRGSRQNYYKLMRRHGESGKTFASTDLRGYEKVDKALTDIDFFQSLERIQPPEYQIAAKMLINGFSKKEVAERLECSPSNVSRILKIIGQFMAEWQNW